MMEFEIGFKGLIEPEITICDNENCKHRQGPNLRVCLCGRRITPIKKREKKATAITRYPKQVEDWRSLQSGRVILVQSNDHYVSDRDGTPHDIGYNAEFKVKRVDKTGLVLYSNKIGWVFMDMEFSGVRKNTSIIRDIPKIWSK